MTESKRFPYEKIAKLDNEERRTLQPASGLVSIVVALRPASLLDVGVGTGYFALPIAEALPGVSVIGLDAEPRMLEIFTSRARERGLEERVRTVACTIDVPGGVPLPDSSVDVALLANLYHELDDRAAALAEVRRLLGDHGRLLLCDWDPESDSPAGPPGDHRCPFRTVEADLKSAGFTVGVRLDVYDDFYTFVASATDD